MTSPLTQPSAHSETAPDFSVVIVCMNNQKYLEPCLRSLYGAQLSHRFDVVVIDNGSTDGTQTMLRDRFPAVQLIQNPTNVGLSRASNQGIRTTCGRYVLLLNDDTLVNGGSLDAMIDFADTHPDASAVGVRLLNADGSVQSCYNKFPSLHEEFLIATRLGELFWRGYPAITRCKKVESVSWVGSACLMLRRTALDAVGLLDEEYFIYGDEADLQYRLKNAGWQVYSLPHATTIHFGGRSMNRWSRRKMVYRGHILFFRKHYGSLRTAALRIMLAVLSLAKMVIWGIASARPRWRQRARNELRSNLEVVALCWRAA